MRLKITIYLALTLAAVTSQTLLAQTGSVLLEKAIFTQETRRNLPEALSLYEEVIANAGKETLIGAEAMYRKGIILKQQSKADAANGVFKKVISEYPSATKFVEAAKKAQTTGRIWSKPWKHGELLEYDMTMSGMPKKVIGHEWRWIEEKDNETIFRTLTSMNGIVFNFSEITADSSTLLPNTEVWEVFALGGLKATFGNSKVEVKMRGREEKSEIPYDGEIYANDQAVYILRCHDLEVGKDISIPLVITMGGSVIHLKAEIKEGGKLGELVPDSYRAVSQIGQDFWVSKGEQKVLAKATANGIVIQLTKIGTNQFDRSTKVEIKNQELQFDLPPGWFAKQRSEKKTQFLALYTQISKLSAHIESIPKLELPEAQQKSAKAFAEAYLNRTKKLPSIQNLKIIEEPSATTVNGVPAVEAVITYTGASVGDRKEYLLWTLGKNGTRFKFATPPENFAKHLSEFEKIARSLSEK